MHLDSYYAIGDGHTFCQDYSLHGEVGDYAFGVVCDGCSSSENSDVGARVWAHTLKKILQSKDEINSQQIYERLKTSEIPDIFDERSLDATIVYFVYDKANDVIHFDIIGDGSIVFLGDDGALVYTVTFPSNAPYYITYERNKNRASEYIETLGNSFGDIRGRYLCWEDGSNTLCGLWKEGKKFSDTFLLGPAKFKNFSKMYNGALVTSDGIETFLDDQKKKIEMKTIYREIANFKNLKGEFVKRRMKAFERKYRKEGWAHFDDISVAAMHL